MSKKKKDRLQLNLKAGERYRHRVAMVNEEGGWNQHEPNAGMARMFVIMLLIHVVVIGGIIIYDYFSGNTRPAVAEVIADSAPPASALPPTSVNAATLEQAMPIENYATYEWRSGDSLPAVAEKLGVAQEVLIKLNMLDKGAQIDQNTILRYPRRPVVKAVGVGVAGAHGEAPKAAHVADSAPPAEQKPKEASVLTPLGEEMSLEPTLLVRLTPAPPIVPGQPVADSPPPARTTQATGPVPVVHKTPAPEKTAQAAPPKVAYRAPENGPAKMPDVPKALPITKEMLQARQTVREPNKKVENASVAADRTAYVVKQGETLYKIASKHGVTVAALQKANNITKPELLREGMKLVIP